mgnify:CR=1 FL=1
MTISFVIPAHNEENHVAKTIEAILKQPEDLVKEIIVSLSPETADRTAEVAGQYPKVKVVRSTVKGTNGTRQAGSDVAVGDIVAFIDADTQVMPGWSERVVKRLANPKVAGVSGPYIYTDQSWVGYILTLHVFLIIAIPIAFIFNYILGIGSVVLGGNVAARRKNLLAVGGLNANFHFFGDDASTGKRLRKSGLMIFDPSLRDISSSRRFRQKGFLKTTLKYFINFFWAIFFDRPFSK